VTARRRLDQELVARGLVTSREQARAAIEAGLVTVGGAPATKAARLVAASEPVHVAAPPSRYVGRGGHKLEAALERFGVDPTGRRALDAGASTGGFTDCLLQHGARSVVALDVGHGQLHARLRADPQVEVLERTNVRHATAVQVGGPVSLLVADLSFISLVTVLDALLGLVEPGGDLVLLVKPQFEAGRAEVSRGRGVVRDPAVWRSVLERVRDALVARGAAMMGAMVSPLTGADGNVEFLIHARALAGADGGGSGRTPVVDLDAVVATAAGSATGPTGAEA
jgi:23S rRNA (cytidine1920-2'-O)/16S rRNA (cytidine1409-2'-O)-methyltransferase